MRRGRGLPRRQVHHGHLTGRRDRPGERNARLGVESLAVGVVVTRERRAGWLRALRGDQAAELGKDLIEEGAEPALRDGPPDGDDLLRREVDERDRLAHSTFGKSPCAARYWTTPPADRICWANGASGRIVA